MRNPAGESKTYTHKLPKSQDQQGLQGQSVFRAQLKPQEQPVLLLWGRQGAEMHRQLNGRDMRIDSQPPVKQPVLIMFLEF